MSVDEALEWILTHDAEVKTFGDMYGRNVRVSVLVNGHEHGVVMPVGGTSLSGVPRTLSIATTECVEELSRNLSKLEGN